MIIKLNLTILIRLIFVRVSLVLHFHEQVSILLASQYLTLIHNLYRVSSYSLLIDRFTRQTNKQKLQTKVDFSRDWIFIHKMKYLQEGQQHKQDGVMASKR